MTHSGNAESSLSMQDQLYQFTAALHRELSLKELLDNIVEQVPVMLTTVSALDIYILEPGLDMWIVKAHRGLSPEWIGTGTFQKNEGITGHTAKKGKPLIVQDLTEFFPRNYVKKEGFRTCAAIPLLFKDEVIGVLDLYSRTDDAFKNPKWLYELGAHIGPVVHRANLYEQTLQNARRYSTLCQVVLSTRRFCPMEDVFNDLSRIINRSLGYNASWIGLVDDEQGILQGKTCSGLRIKTESFIPPEKIERESRSPAVRAIIEKQPVICQTLDEVEDPSSKKNYHSLNIRSLAFIPVLGKEKAQGVIGVFSVNEQAFHEGEMGILVGIAEHASTVIENATLFDRMRKSETQYRTLFESANTSIVVLDEHLKFCLVNTAFEKLSGYKRAKLIEKMTIDVFIKKEPEGNVALVFDRTHPQSFEAVFCSKERPGKQVHVTTTPIPDSGNLLVSLVDISRQKELERRLYRSEKLAQIGELSAGIAHEIRNPLVSITTSVSLLKDETEISEEGRQLLDIVKEESDHLAAIVDDFLKYARPKKPHFQDEDVNQILKDVVKRYREWNCKNIQWLEEYDDLPMVPLDRHQVQQVVTNLMLNSIEAIGEEGTIKIRTVIPRDSKNRVCIRISDSGIGIPEDQFMKIFQPFFSTKEKGTGMGLAICRRIIEEHDGKITVHSETGKGSTFTVTLPTRRNREETE